MRLAPLEVQADRAPLPSARVASARVEPVEQARSPRRGDRTRYRRPLHRDEPRRSRENALREGLLCPWQRREPDQGHEALHALRQDGVLAMAGEPVPAAPARRRLLAAAFLAAGGSEALAVARRHVRNDPAHVREGRCPRRGAEGQNQARLPGQLPSGGHARNDDRRHHDRRPMTDAAGAAGALTRQPRTRSQRPRSHRRRPGRRLMPHRQQKTTHE